MPQGFCAAWVFFPVFFRLARSCVNAPLGVSSVIPEQTERAMINLFSLFAHSPEFFPSRDQVLEQCLCDYHRGYPHRAHGPTLALPKKNAPATKEDTSLKESWLRLRTAAEVGWASTRRGRAWGECAGAAGTEGTPRNAPKRLRGAEACSEVVPGWGWVLSLSFAARAAGVRGFCSFPFGRGLW